MIPSHVPLVLLHGVGSLPETPHQSSICVSPLASGLLLSMQELAEKKAELEALETGGNVRGGASQDTRSVDELLHFIGAVEGSHSQGKAPGKGKKKKAKKKKGPSSSPPRARLAWWLKAA